jgi:hypothetical protein
MTMAHVEASITNLRIEEQSLAFDLMISGDPGGSGAPVMIIYDAQGVEHDRSFLGTMEVDQPWNAVVDIPVAKLPDGDYGAWVFVNTTAADGTFGPQAEAGVSFLMGRGRVYPSREQADEPSDHSAPGLSSIRLEGSWIVFDMTNREAFDVEVDHELSVSAMDLTNEQKFNGLELVRAGATQQGHYLLPEDLADGRWMVSVTIQVAGSNRAALTIAYVHVAGGVLTLAATGL